MRKLYFIKRIYSPNMASTNRVLGWARGLSECNVDAEFVFFAPSDNFDKIPEVYPHIKFTYMWDKLYINNKNLKFISLFIYIITFVLKLKKGDMVYIYSCPDILKWVLKRKDVHVYDEITEHPDASLRGNRFFKPNTVDFINDCKKLDGLFVISENLKQYFISQGIDNDKIHLLNMTVDDKRFDGLIKQETGRYIAYCGSATNTKDGVDQLIKAFAITSRTHPDVKLYIIGPKPKQGQEFSNLNLPEELGIANKVIFTGTVKANEIPRMLINAEICALNRPDNLQAKYGFPTKLGEYLLSGNPVVITKVGNISDFLEDGVSALIVNPDCPEMFSQKLNWALDHPDEAQKIGKNGREVALKQFNYKIETKKIIKTFDLI